MPALQEVRFAVRGTEQKGDFNALALDCFIPFLDVTGIVHAARYPSFEMVVGMVAERVAGVNDLVKDIRMFVDILAHHEERSRNVVLGKDVQHFRGHFRDRSIIESEIYSPTRTENGVRVEGLEDVL